MTTSAWGVVARANSAGPKMTQGLFDLNRHGVLRAPTSLWLCAAFLLRYWALLVLVVSSWLGPPENVAWAYGLMSWAMLLVESPMLLLLCAGMRRVPQGGAWARWLWRRGRETMALTALLSVAWALWFLVGRPVWDPVPERVIAALALVDAAILVGSWRSPLFRAVFDEFPDPGSPQQSAS